MRTLRGHATDVHGGVAFSPDGTRLASASVDGTVKLWDTASGNEVAMYKFEGRVLYAIAFSPNGSWLAVEASDEKERRVTMFLSAGSTAERLVERLLEDLILPANVVARLQADAGLLPAVRDDALRIARDRHADPVRLNKQAWSIVSAPGGEPAEYLRALRQIEAACTLDPANRWFLNTLGAAQYRVGRFRQALATLEKSDRLNNGLPADLAFIAMAHHRLGDAEPARLAMARLRKCFELGSKRIGGISASLLNEAEALVGAGGGVTP